MPDYRRSLKPALIVLASILIVAASFGGGVYVGYERRPAIDRVAGVLGQETGKPAEVDFSQFWEVWSALEEKFVDRADIDRKTLVEGAIAGLVRALGDPYSVYLPPRQTQLFREDVRGSFGGIGAEIGIRREVLTIIAPLRGSPAERVGIKAGDKILTINASSTADMSLEEAVSKIRGEVGSTVVLAITRDSFESVQEFTVARETIVIPIIETKDLGRGIFSIHLLNFNESSPLEFRKAIREFLFSGNKKLILDLRSNPGGFLDASVDIASWFIPAGEPVARELLADGREIVYRSSGHRLLEHTPMVILVDQGSASAAEILAGAIRDSRGIKLVGAKTFGKGSVQEVDNLRGGASLKITIAKWLTPKGTSINDKGLEPDIAVEVMKEDADEGRDPVLEKGIEILKTL